MTVEFRPDSSTWTDLGKRQWGVSVDLKNRCPQGRGGSTPPLGTILFEYEWRVRDVVGGANPGWW